MASETEDPRFESREGFSGIKHCDEVISNSICIAECMKKCNKKIKKDKYIYIYYVEKSISRDQYPSNEHGYETSYPCAQRIVRKLCFLARIITYYSNREIGLTK
jgi:hypothetical protein